jgi:hypothetical protein
LVSNYYCSHITGRFELILSKLVDNSNYKCSVLKVAKRIIIWQISLVYVVVSFRITRVTKLHVVLNYYFPNY